MSIIITFMSIRGGSGKSTITIATWKELETRGKSIFIFDCDKQKTSLYFTSYARQLNLPFAPIKYIESNLSEEVEKIKEKYDFILIDTPSGIQNICQEALKISDLIITPLNTTIQDIWSFSQLEKVIEEAKKINKKLKHYIVLSKIDKRMKSGKEGKSIIEKQIKTPIFQAVITYKTAWIEAISSGKGIIKKSQQEKEIKDFVDEVLTIV